MIEEKYLTTAQFEGVKKVLRIMRCNGYSIKDCLACIYDLFQEYLISEAQEMELYKLANPDDLYNEVSMYWQEYDGGNPMKAFLQ